MNLSFIKLDINILDDSKIRLLRKYPDGDKLIVLWVGLLCLAMKSDNPGYVYVTSGIPYTDKDLSVILDIEEKTIQMGLKLFEQFNMIEIIKGGVIEIINFNKHQNLDKIEKAKEKSRISSKKYREKQKQLLLSDGHVIQSDKTDKEIDKEKEKNKNKEKENVSLLNDIEEIYQSYPTKDYKQGFSTGRCQKNRTQIKQLLKKHSKDQILNEIEKFIDERKKCNISIKTFSRFLDEFPDIEDLEEKIQWKH
jgi:predicted phage replisome organizer